MAAPPSAPPVPSGPVQSFAGRRDLVDLFLLVIDTARSGAAATVVVVGAAGLGKSRAAGEAASIARQHGFNVASVSSLSPSLPQLVSYRLAEELGISDLDDGGSAVLFRRLRAEIDRSVATGRPLVIVVDDLDGCGGDDLALLRDLALRPPTGPFILIVTTKHSTAASTGHGPLLAELRSRANAEFIDLLPMSVDEVGELSRQQLDSGAIPRSFVEAVHDVSGGNPSYATALLDEVGRLPESERIQILLGSRDLESVKTPAAVRSLLGARLATLDALDRRIVRALAAWRQPITLPGLLELTDLDEETLADTLGTLEDRQLIGSFEHEGTLSFALAEEFAAKLIREDTPLLTLRRLHGRASKILMAREPRPQAAAALGPAEHYVAADGPLDDTRIETVIEAARWLNVVSRYGQSHDLLTCLVERLTAEQPTRAVPPESYALLAEASARLGTWDDAERVLASARPSIQQGDARARLLFRAARDHVSQGNDVEALRLYQLLLEDSDLTPSMRLRITEDVGRVSDQLGQHEEARAIARQAAQDAEDIGEIALASDIWVSYHALLLSGAEAQAPLAVLRRALWLARRSGSAQALARVYAGFGDVFADLGPLERGLRWLRRSLNEAQACGDTACLAWVAGRLAQAYTESGDWDQARAAAQLAIDTDVALHRPRGEARARALLSVVDSLGGNDAKAVAQLVMIRNGSFGQLREVSPGIAHFEQAVGAGELHRAIEYIDTAREALGGPPSRRHSLLLELLPRQGAVLGALGDADRLRETLDAFDGCVAEIPESATPIVAAQRYPLVAELAAATGDLTASADGFEVAAEVFGAIGYRWRRSLALRRQGEVLAQLGALDDAVRVLSDAFAESREIGALPVLRSIRLTLRGIGHRPPRARRARSGVPTERERQVIELAARGMRDAEIARELWISPRTVTTHMYNVLGKLGLRSRHELSDWLAANRSADGEPR